MDIKRQKFSHLPLTQEKDAADLNSMEAANEHRVTSTSHFPRSPETVVKFQLTSSMGCPCIGLYVVKTACCSFLHITVCDCTVIIPLVIHFFLLGEIDLYKQIDLHCGKLKLSGPLATLKMRILHTCVCV